MNRVYLDPNTKYSDQYAMLAKLPDIVDEINEVADKAEQVPDPAVADIGKVLGIVSDGESGAKIDAVEPSGGLPAISAGDAGKVLTVNVGETGAEWDSVPQELPAIGSGDAGKVLKVNAGETGVEWGAAGAGNSPLIVTSTYDETDQYYHLDKTFGEIRAAINAGRSVVVVMADTSESFDTNNTNIIMAYSYTIGLNPESPEASGTVTAGINATYDVVCASAPYTLAALDALYPLGQ